MRTDSAGRTQRFIYLACPWTPKGGGMYKVADYLIQAQAGATQDDARSASQNAAELRPLDTRGDGSAIGSLLMLLRALALLVLGRLSGQLAGVHVNMAERLSLLRKGTVVLACRALGLPVVLHLHAAQLHHFYRRLPGPLQALTRWVFSLANSVVVLGTASQRFVTQELGVAPGRVEILINGVPEPTVPRRVRAPLAQNAPRTVTRDADQHSAQHSAQHAAQQAAPAPLQLLFVGNLSARKGVSELLQAMAAPALAGLPLQLTLAGGGDLAHYLGQAQALGLAKERVRFAGWTEQAELARMMAAADALVLPSYDEGLPLVVLEALANGVAVVCTPVGEIPSVLTDGDNALLVPPGDVPALAHALSELVHKPALREKLEGNGRALYAQHFSLSRFFAGVARIHRRHFGVAAQAADATSATSATSATTASTASNASATTTGPATMEAVNAMKAQP